MFHLDFSPPEAQAEMDNVIDLIDNDGEGGNTNSPSPKQVRRWCFTYQIDSVDQVDGILAKLHPTTRYVCQVERAPTTGQLHIQGYCEFKNGRTFNGMRKLIEGAHWEPAKGDSNQNYDYCTKDESRAMGPFYKGFPAKPMTNIVELKPWQRKVWSKYQESPDDRTIYWFYDTVGGVGKTAMAKYLCIKGNCCYVNGKANDVKCAVAAMHKEGKPIKCVIWGIPRSYKDYVSYAAIEEIKDGIFFSGKYESSTVVMESPHIFVFCNFYPDVSQLSDDRWRIYNINGGDLDGDL